MFSYYGPMHDGVAWKLALLPKNNPLPRTWHLVDVPDGDRIGECLFQGHTLDEAMILTQQICHHWQQGLQYLRLPENNELQILANALSVLFASGLNILKFYHLRARLGKGEGDAGKYWSRCEKLCWKS